MGMWGSGLGLFIQLSFQSAFNNVPQQLAGYNTHLDKHTPLELLSCSLSPLKTIGCCGGLRCQAPTADQSHFSGTVHLHSRGTLRPKAHPKSPQILPLQSKRDSQQRALPQEADASRPLSRPVRSYQLG
ncbi:Hypothetical predicted protein [Xyrichtys novacula]|uniref:Uncharacterized protein n=1 Tax=Xyrichtys novacula TaxID=13765 RepID=A0AAV1G2I4_XYRNO|nr:Hypothetical predicted protein [Xyrichtys novacula]